MSKSNIVLVGFMGTGKSAAGRVVARRLGYRLVEMDARIEERVGQGIPDIFAQQGEAFFRERERELVIELAAQSRQVVSAGGGVALNPDNIADFSRNGVVICLTASPEAILGRVGHDPHRPLLAGDDKEKKIRALLASRKSRYDAIPRQIDTTRLTVEQVADRILAIRDQPADETVSD